MTAIVIPVSDIPGTQLQLAITNLTAAQSAVGNSHAKNAIGVLIAQAQYALAEYLLTTGKINPATLLAGNATAYGQ